MVRALFIFILCFYIVKDIGAQCVLTIRQTGIKKDSIPDLIVLNYEEEDKALKRINDSTLELTCTHSEPDYLYIIMDNTKRPRWKTRVWVEPTMKRRDLVIDYSRKTVTLDKPSEWDIILKKIDSYEEAQRHNSADSISTAYIEQHPDSYTSLWLFTHSSFIGDGKTKKEKLTVFNKLNSSLNIYPEYRQVKASIFDRKYPVTGDPFKEFSLYDIHDKVFNSAPVKNKWILLHFWSTGCAPCIKEMGDMVDFYSSLDTSKIAFISVSLDDDKNKWKNSKVTGKIKWTSVWQPDNFYGDLCLNYNVTAMPFFIIFDKNKKLHLITYGADELELVKSTLRARTRD